MEKQFVTYEIALKLKELGFDEKCFGYYGNKYGEVELFSEFVLDHSKNIFYTQSRTETSAPLWQQVIDWLREKHKIDIYPEPTYSLTEYSFKVITVHGKSKKQEYWDGMGKTYNTYQKAREQAILKALELCKR